MKIRYTCDCCGKLIDTLELEDIDETKLGFDILNEEEKRSLIQIDAFAGVMIVQSLCDGCIELLGLPEPANQAPGQSTPRLLH